MSEPKSEGDESGDNMIGFAVMAFAMLLATPTAFPSAWSLVIYWWIARY
ncbi:MAG: hypothetical protein RLZZ76_147 [Candidatus Parcubacteria bacterium]|jgi:hypothetical protein